MYLMISKLDLLFLDEKVINYNKFIYNFDFAMGPEKTYRVDHIFRPLTSQKVEEYHQKLSYMEKQFLVELERFKSEGPLPKPAPTSQREHQPKRKPLNIKFEEDPAKIKPYPKETVMEELSF